MFDKAMEVISNGDFCTRYPFVRLIFTFDEVQELARIQKEKAVAANNGQNKKSQ